MLFTVQQQQKPQQYQPPPQQQLEQQQNVVAATVNDSVFTLRVSSWFIKIKEMKKNKKHGKIRKVHSMRTNWTIEFQCYCFAWIFRGLTEREREGEFFSLLVFCTQITLFLFPIDWITAYKIRERIVFRSFYPRCLFSIYNKNKFILKTIVRVFSHSVRSALVWVSMSGIVQENTHRG